VVFTSLKDDAHCGDTNGDGTATSPAVADWENIDTNGRNGSVFDYCIFHYGGGGSYDNTLSLSAGSNATIVNSTFSHNKGNGDGALDASDAIAGTVIKANYFYDNEKPMYIDTTFSMDDSNVFHNPSNVSETNTYNGIFLDYPNDFTSSITWQETEVPFVINDGDLWINTGYSLTLGNNVVIKFMLGSEMVLEDGTSSIVNYGGTGVYFTSYKDDARKGDTNGDGSATSPAANDWGGLYDDSGGIPSPYYYTWSNILYDSY
jgi:hypothetical protein